MLRFTTTQPPSSQMISLASNSSSSSSESSSSSHGTLSSATSFRSQSPRSPVHAASLVDPIIHSPELMQLIEIELSRPVIEYVVDCVFETVDQALARSGLRLLSAQRASYRNRFTPFVATVLSRATVRTPTLLVALVYIVRARPHLAVPSARRAPESVFLGALIAAAKYTNDSVPRNAHWARCSGGVFSVRDVSRIEREFLAVLDWELGVAEADLLGLPRREEMVAAAARAVHPSVESASTLTSVEDDADHPFLRPLQRHHRRSSSAGSAPVPDLLPSSASASASPASSAGTASPPTPPPPVFTVPVLDVAEHPRPLTISKKRERGRLSALLHGHWHVFHHGHRTGAGQLV